MSILFVTTISTFMWTHLGKLIYQCKLKGRVRKLVRFKVQQVPGNVAQLTTMLVQLQT
jgi:hypothetical protein